MSFIPTGTVWHHKKTGHLYVIIGETTIEAGPWAAFRYIRLRMSADEDEAPMGEWVRPQAEFLDGRFERWCF